MAIQLKEVYKKRTGAAGAAGHFMEINLLTLFKLQGDKRVKDFHLAGNLETAGDFDDVVFRYTNEEDRQNVMFLQAKSKDNANHKVTIDKFKKGGEWGLYKYFQSYLAIQNYSRRPEIGDPIFQNGIAHIDCNYIIYTNAARDDSLLEFADELSHKPLDIVFNESCGHALRLKAEVVKDILREVQDDIEIEQVMTWMKVISGVAGNTLKGDENFQMYHAFFIHTIFTKYDKQWKLQDEFLEGVLKNNAHVKFREKIFDWHAETKLGAIKGKIRADDREKAKMEIKKWMIQLPKWFEKQTPKFDKELCDQFIDIARGSCNSGNVCTISNFGKKFEKKVAEFVGNVFVLDEGCHMFKMNEKQLDGEPGKVHEYLLKKLGTSGLRFDFKLDKFPKLALGFTTIDDRILHFNRKLTILTGQPDANDLQEMIKSECLGNMSRGEAQIRYLEISKRMTTWWQQSGEPNYLKKNDYFLYDIMKGVTFNLKANVDLFIGRTDELNHLHSALQNGDQTVVISQMASISGLGGIGKTELARKYANEYKDSYDGNVIWIDAEKYESMVACFRRLCKNTLNISTQDANNKEKDITSIVQEVYSFFKHRECLFIFDNANCFNNSDGVNYGIEPFLPTTKTGITNPHFLITSRNQRWPRARLELDVFTDAEAEQLVRSKLKIKISEQDIPVRELIKQLQNFPLALQQAIAYIRERDKMNHRATGIHFTIQDYIQLLTDKTKQLLSYKFPNDFPDHYTKTTFMTWEITLAEIEKHELGQVAKKIFNIMAFLSPTDMPITFFMDSAHISQDQLTEVVNLLADYSMINLHEGLADIHRLVQWVARLTINDAEKKDVLKTGLDLVRIHTDHYLIKHGATLWNNARNNFDLVNEYHDVPAKIMEALRESVRYEQAYEFGEKSLESLQRALGNDHIAALALQTELAHAMNAIGKYTSALSAFQHVFNIHMRDQKGTDNTNALNAQHSIGYTLSELGRYDEALASYKELNEKQIQILGPDNTSTLATRHNIANTLSRQGQYDKALASYMELNEKQIKILGPDDTTTLATQHNIANTLSELGKYNEALASFKELNEKQIKILGPDNPFTLTTQRNIASTRSRLGKYDEALASFKELNEIQIQILGPDNPSTLTTQHNIANTLYKMGKYDEALASLKEVYEKKIKILGPGNPSTLATQHNIANTLSELGKYDEALASYKELNENQTQILGPDNPTTLITQHNIANTLSRQGQYDEALASYKELNEKQIKILGPDNPTTLATQHNIANILSKLGKYDEALVTYKQVFEKEIQTLGPDNPTTLITQHNIANTLSKLGKYDEALAIYKQVFDKEFQTLGPDNPSTLITQQNIANTLRKMIMILHPNHPETATTRRNNDAT